MMESDDYKRGWYDGYQAAQRQNPTITQPPITVPTIKVQPANYVCSVCGIDFGTNKTWGYVCNFNGCPSRITALNSTVAGSNYKPMGGAGANGGTEHW